METVYKRGDLVLIKFPLVQDFSKIKERPALIIQNDIGNRYSPNLIVASISSKIPSVSYPTHFAIRADSEVGSKAGLKVDSNIETEIIMTIPKFLVVKKLGSLPPEIMQIVDKKIKISLGLR
ncbi:MAG: type II toxin-antitoxin system PemK/MazF family toxin [Methanosarcinales archaeon]